MTKSIFDIFPQEIVKEICSQMDLQTIGRFSTVSILANKLSRDVKRNIILQKFVKRYKAIIVKRISPDTALIIHPIIFDSFQYNTNSPNFLVLDPQRLKGLGHYQINLDNLTKILISRSEFIQKVYPKAEIDYENMPLIRRKKINPCF
jgi:hypothetical protein